MEIVVRINCSFFRMGTVLDPCHYQACQKTHVPGKLAHQRKCTSLPHITLCFQVMFCSYRIVHFLSDISIQVNKFFLG